MSQKKVSHKTYQNLLSGISGILQEARRASARTVNSILTATYWEIGRRIVEFEQRGMSRAQYGEEVLRQLSVDLQNRFGRGFTERNLRNMRQFYLYWPNLVKIKKIRKGHAAGALSLGMEKWHAVSAKLSWTHYRRLLTVEEKEARSFYEKEAIRGGWSVRQLDRQINSQFYERLLLSRNKTAMLKKGESPKPEDVLTPEEEIKDPTVLEFLNLKDEYSESDLEDALIHKLEDFLLEMGYGFTFVARQKRLCIDDEWYRIDLLLYHRKLRCLVVIDLKIGRFTHADAGQMNLYLNYVAENMTLPEENPPVGIILCSQKRDAVAHYALGGLRSKVLTSEYRLALPKKKELESKLKKAQMELKKQKGH
jgi:predicted nuclease of restriction endonuclease-like (RecB) superfamily